MATDGQQLPPWGEAAIELAEWLVGDGADAVKEAVEECEVGAALAVEDWIPPDGPWRKVFLLRQADNKWVLLDEGGAVLDEPDAGCPASGFSKESLLADVGLDYYRVFTMDCHLPFVGPKGLS